MNRFPTAEERWKRRGIVIKMTSDIVFLIGNGESRKDFDLTQLRQYGKIYGCNALYRDFKPDVLVAVDHGISHEIYNTGYAKENKCVFRSWTKVPKAMFEGMVMGGADPKEVDDFQRFITIHQNIEQKEYAKEFVYHGQTLSGVVGILRRGKNKGETDEIIKKQVNHSGTYISWIYENDKSESLDDFYKSENMLYKPEKDRGWACGSTSGVIATRREQPKKVFLIGHDLNSTTHKINNVYKGTTHYGLPEASPIPSVNWITQWAHLFTESPTVQFYKVNKLGTKGNNFVDVKINEWSGIKNLIYIDYPKMLDILGDL